MKRTIWARACCCCCCCAPSNDVFALINVGVEGVAWRRLIFCWGWTVVYNNGCWPVNDDDDDDVWLNNDGLTTTQDAFVVAVVTVVPVAGRFEAAELPLVGKFNLSNNSILIGRPNVFCTIWRIYGNAN